VARAVPEVSLYRDCEPRIAVPLVYVLIPVLARPERVEPLLASLRASAREVELRPLFIVSPGDDAELAALQEAGAYYVFALWECGAGDYARKINFGAGLACDDGADWIFTGADDLCFCVGWADEAVREGVRHGKAFVGTNDLGNALVRAGRHSTHSLVRVDYLDAGTIDEPGKLLHEGYDHQYVDTEAVGTAMFRDEWVFARGSVVEHLHPFWGKSSEDGTYRKALRAGEADMRLFQSRQHLWARALQSTR
jgi:hypothetical protein